ncbi:uncharacterized protein METZ01_LOCUS6561 [marine metagenome]|jgi:hypothetical protein|uniref:Uncharacterized protein n=1 Tax=marine metagenome TaxID=408172 RepID=A0A381NGP1_9ZZZZ|tara:strand:- start:197 stop:367 length:171 start_codon:yes stop_codon:yes gene_type:complete
MLDEWFAVVLLVVFNRFGGNGVEVTFEDGRALMRQRLLTEARFTPPHIPVGNYGAV